MATAATPAGLRAPSAGRARSSRALRRLGRGVDAREASMRYHEELMGGRDRAERAMGETTAVKIDASETEGEAPKKTEPKADRWASLMDPRGQAGPISAGDPGLDRGASAEGAGAGLRGYGVEAMRAVQGNRDQPGGPLRGEVQGGRHVLAVLREEEDDVRQLRGSHR